MATLGARSLAWLVPVMLAAAALSPASAAPAAAAPAAAAAEPPAQAGGFTAVTASRILDTRLGLGAPLGKVGPARTLDLQVTGRGGIPSTGVAAVALNVTVTQPTDVGYLTVYPSGTARPLASNANFAPGQTLADAMVVKLGAGGGVSIFNSAGTSDLVADVAGWFATTRNVGGGFTPVPPTRTFDSRASQPVGPAGTVRVRVADGLPAGVSAVALNVTATEPSTGGYLTAYPAGEARPTASNLNVVAGQTRANFVAVKVPVGGAGAGAVDIFNSNGTTHVIVDLLGYWSPTSNSRMSALTPTRVLDTRSGLGGADGALGAGQTAVLQLPGTSAVPAAKVAAVVLNVTATQPTAGGYLTVYPGSNRPVASNLNFAPGETVPNLVVVPVDGAGQVKIYNSGGQTHVIVDVMGWFDLPAVRLDVAGLSTFGSEVVVDRTSTYAYISNTGRNQVEVLRLADATFESPIPVGSQPMGLDLTPAGDRLYVADRGSVMVSVVDVGARAELRRFPVPSGFSADHPYSISVLANGKALLTTTFGGSGFGANMYQVDLATDAVTPRPDFYMGGTTTEATSIRASGDRRSAVVTAGDISSGPVFRYDTVTDTFTKEVDTATYTSGIATNADGTATLVNGGGMVFDARLNLAGSIPGCGTNGVAVNASGTMGYGIGYDFAAGSAYVAACDLARFTVTNTVPIGPATAVGRLAISPDGATLVGVTDSGVVLVGA